MATTTWQPVEWMDGNRAQTALLFYRFYRASVDALSCPAADCCFLQWLKCTDLCRLKEYQNRPEEAKDPPDLNCTDDESDGN